MSKKIIFYSVLGVGIILGLQLFLTTTNAFNPFDISYPVAELGNCNSQGECKTFCDDSANHIACFEWAAKQGIVSEREVKRVKDMRRFDEEAKPIEDFGPGGCRTPRECDVYCRVEENLEECLRYGVKHGYTTQDEADRIRSEASKKGPGNCDSRESCDDFCRDPQNMQECMRFVVEEGKITQEEADFLVQQAKKHLEDGPRGPDGPRNHDEGIDEEKAIEIIDELGGGPGGCKTMDECDKFCGNPDNNEICMAFAVEHKLIDSEKAEKVKRMMEMGGPGGCRGQEECDRFCGQPGNGEICMNFAIESGMMSPDEVEKMKREMEIMKKLDERPGPHGCRGPMECKKVCMNPDFMEECMKFATESGMMGRDQANMMIEQVHRMEEMTEMKKEYYDKFNPESDFGPLQGFGPGPSFGSPPGEEGSKPLHEFYPMDTRGTPAPSGEGYEHGNFDPNRRDFQRFDDYKEFKRKFEERRFNGLEDFTSPEKEMLPPEGMRPEDFYREREFEKEKFENKDREEFGQYKGFVSPEDGFVPPGFAPQEGFFKSPEGSYIPSPEGKDGEGFNHMYMMQPPKDGFGSADSFAPPEEGFMPYHNKDYVPPTSVDTAPTNGVFIPTQEFKPTDSYIPPTESNYIPSPEGDYMKEPPPIDGPTSLIAPQSLLGSVLAPVINIFR